MKVLAVVFLFNFLSADLPSGETVYLCDSEGGKKYHFTKSCRGLANCEHEIIKVSISEAQRRGKTLCGWED